MNQFGNIFSQCSTSSERLRILLFSLFAICVVTFSVAFFILSMVKPYTGIKLSIDKQDWRVESVDVNGAAFQAGIRVGDRPLKINAQLAESFLGKYIEVGTVLGYLISEITVVDASGQLKSVAIEDSSPIGRSVIDATARFVVSLIFWITGYYVFLKKPKNVAALLLLLCGLVFGLAISANMAADRAIPAALQLTVASTVFGPWLLLHFFLILPEERTGLRNNPLIYLVYLPPAITLLFFFFMGYADGQPVQWFRNIRFLEAGIVFVGTISVVIFNFHSALSARTKQQMKIILVACLSALIPLLIFYALPAGMGGQPIIPGAIGILFLAFVPVGMGYAVATQKLMDIDVIIRRGLIYGLVAVIMTVILSAAIFYVIAFHESLGVPGQIVIALILGSVATVLFGPVRKWVEAMVDRVFYKDRYDYRQIIQGVSTALNQVKDTTEVSRLVVGTTVRTLNLAGGSLFVKVQSSSFELGAAQGVHADTSIQVQLLTLIAKRNRIIEFPNSASPVSSALAFLIPLVAGEREVGILCVSQKVSRQDFSSDDLFLLQGLAPIVAMALQSVMLVRDVSLRDTFVSVASHELRTPLTSILGYADLLLRRNPPDATRKRWLKNILDNSQRVSAMVDDLLNVSRIQSGKASIKLDRMSLSDILEETLSLIKESSKEHEFVIEIEPDLPGVLVDRDKFSQVVGNLLSNAVKYSPGGGRVMLSAHNDKERHQIVVSVGDEGIGIGPEDKDLLFTTFHRIQRPETQGIKGSGLGLYIAKEWTEAMGGNIWLESELNKGSTFFVGIPTKDSKGAD